MKKSIFLLATFLIAGCAAAQTPMGQWKTHLAYSLTSQVAQSAHKVFALSVGKVYSVDKSSGTIEYYSRLTGLNGTSASYIDFDSISNNLLITYSDGNIDLITNSGIVNIPDFYNKQMSSSKTVSDVCFFNKRAYLACNFGIVVLNLSKYEVADTYYIGNNASEVNVASLAISNGSIYAMTSDAIYKASVSESNLGNYENWSQLSALPGSGSLQKLVNYSGKLVLMRGNKVYISVSGNSWTQIMSDVSPLSLKVSQGLLFVLTQNATYQVDQSLNVTELVSLAAMSDVVYDKTNNLYWLAAGSLGVVSRATNAGSPVTVYYKPEGPAADIPWDMVFSGKKLFVVQGGAWAGEYSREGVVMMYENSKWSNVAGSSVQQATGYSPLDFMTVAVDPADNTHFYIPAYGRGLYEFKQNAFDKWYNLNNSTITSIDATSPYRGMRLTGAAIDDNNNLFVVNTTNSKTVELQIKTASDAKWTKHDYYFSNANQSLIPTTGKIMISNLNQNQKWIPSLRYATGLCVIDDNGTVTDQTDDKSVFFQSFSYSETDGDGNTTLQSMTPNFIFSMAQDKNGVVWLGTDKGPILFQNLSNVFNSDYTCSRVKIARNDSTNLADYLLDGVRIRSIAIDGANRKWLGTETSGVYLMSENGQKTIHHFTSSNSPLLSDYVMSIAINPSSGEVYFGTENGIISYQSDAAESGEEFVNVHAYPNPVRHSFTGVVTITGLIKNTQVKITDINGNLVCQTVSNGSVATWDAKDLHGRRVNTGVYLAMCANEDGTKTTITKILVVN